MKTSIAVGFLAAFVLLGLGWFVVQKNSVTHIAPVATSTPLVASTTAQIDMTPVVLRARVSTEGWKTCKNIGMGYEFQYPKEWFIYTQEESRTPEKYGYTKPAVTCNTRGPIQFSSTPLHLSPFVDNEKVTAYSFSFDPNKEKQTVDEVAVSNIKYGLQANESINDPNSRLTQKILKVLSINGNRGLLIGIFHRTNYQDSVLYYESLRLVDPDKKWNISFDNNKYDSSSGALINDTTETILSTLHFLKK